MKRNKLIRNVNDETINKINKLCTLLDVNQSKLLEIIINYYFENNETELRRKALELIKVS